ncbi:MAG TPA: hypothetical protein VIJ52_01440, partial [Pseudolabrys sp.]
YVRLPPPLYFMDCRVKPGNDGGASHGRASIAALKAVMRGPDPRIHDSAHQNMILRKATAAALFHGLPGQARQ